MYVWVHACRDVHAEVRGQLAGTGCLLPPCGVLGIKLKPSGSAASAFIRWAILLAPLELFLLASVTVWRKLFKRLWENQAAKSHRILLSCMWSLPGCGIGHIKDSSPAREVGGWVDRAWTSHPRLFELSVSLSPDISGEKEPRES